MFRVGKTAFNAFAPGPNRGMLASTLDRIANSSTTAAWCAEIHTYIRVCEDNRFARTGARRLPGFENTSNVQMV
jgi:hypothetical protein